MWDVEECVPNWNRSMRNRWLLLLFWRMKPMMWPQDRCWCWTLSRAHPWDIPGRVFVFDAMMMMML